MLSLTPLHGYGIARRIVGVSEGAFKRAADTKLKQSQPSATLRPLYLQR